MASSNAKPTILLVHGLWHPPKFYKHQLGLLEDAGFPTTCPLQPTVGNPPPVSLKEDAQVIREELTRLVETEGKDVLVIAHSYGGIVATEAVDAAFGRKQRAAQHQAGGVVHILFVSAFIVPLGENLVSMLGGDPDQLPPFVPADEKGLCMILEPERRFYNDLPEAEQKAWAAQLVPCSADGQIARTTHAAYRYHPCTYLFCDNDQGVPLFLQEKMVAAAEEANSITFGREHCSSGHSPFLSQPETMVRVVEKIAVSTSGTP